MVSELHEGARPDLDTLLSGVPSLAGRPRQVRELPGGLTNRNYQVTTPDGVFVARVSLPGGELLGIDREREYRDSVTAAAAGVGAPVIEHCPRAGVLVLGFLSGRTLTNADVAEPDTLRRIAAACRRLHQGGRFVADFDMFAIQRRYLDTARSRGVRIPAGYEDLAPQFRAAEAALAARPRRTDACGTGLGGTGLGGSGLGGTGVCGTVPCHNDLLAANIIDDGEQIRLIDYEYAGNNDPCFELGNIWAECQLSVDGLAELVTAYYGRPRPGKVASARLLGLAGKYGWTLWGAIQSAASSIDFDFWSWATERFEGAAAGLRSAEFPRLLEEAQRDD